MKSFYRTMSVLLLVLLFGCQQQQTFTDQEKETIKKEVKEQFNQLVNALNQKDASTWSGFYSKEEFISAIVSTDFYGERNAWVEIVSKYFSMRESQKVDPIQVRVNALTPNLALLTSEEKTEMKLKDGKVGKSKHVFSMIWKKEQAGWKILHSQESWIDEPGK